MRKVLWIIPVVLLLPTLRGCKKVNVWARAKQVRTYANLQVIAKRGDDFRLEHGNRISDSELKKVVDSVALGRDEWGNPFLFMVTGDGNEFVVLSRGADGKIDQPIASYFKAKERRVDYQFDSDIVFRNGLAVLNAGK